MREWFRNLWSALSTVLQGLFVTLRTMNSTYKRRAFTEVYEYPEVPVPVKPRYRGFHRFDLTTCIGCDKCARACPVDCIALIPAVTPANRVHDTLLARQPQASDLRKKYIAHQRRFAERAEARAVAHAPKPQSDKQALLADILARAKARAALPPRA